MDNRRKSISFGGYDADFINDPPDDLLCLICLFPAREATQLNCCGKIFCASCLQEYNRRNKQCSHCRSTTGAAFKDMRSKTLLLLVVVLLLLLVLLLWCCCCYYCCYCCCGDICRVEESRGLVKEKCFFQHSPSP